MAVPYPDGGIPHIPVEHIQAVHDVRDFAVTGASSAEWASVALVCIAVGVVLCLIAFVGRK